MRDALHADAVKLARHVGYRNAGTVEFMVAADGKSYFFLEVNPRIQVEHTVTEEVTGVDLVQAQIRIAGGASLADLGLPDQASVPGPLGYAIQCRITCEDPERNFQPDAGRIQAYRSPGGPGIRLDGAMTAGNVVSRHYDSLLVKVIVRANTFTHTVQKMQRALFEFHIRGVKTNILFLENVLRHPEFLSGEASTSFIERHPALFNFSPAAGQATKLLNYLADVRVNGPDHPGAVGPAPSRIIPLAPVLPGGLDAPPPAGWRDVLVRGGPDAWAAAVRAHSGVLLTDTTMRDAHQSLLATRMRTFDMLKAAPATARVLAPAASLELWGGATFDVALRFLHECPWRRLELLREAIPNIPFQMLFRGANAVGYTSYPDNVVRAFVQEAHTAGVDIFRVFDSLNYKDNLLFGVDAVRSVPGAVAEGTLCYTGDITNPARSSKYTLDYYLDLADALVGAGVHALAVKDMAGLLKPRAATALVSALRAAHPDMPIAVHTHDTAGTGVATLLAAAAAGADVVDAAVDAMSGTTSQPSMGALVASLAGTPLDTGVDPAALARLSAFWEGTRALYAPFESDMKSSSSDVYAHEMPGGQYTNLKFQAASLGLGPARWEEVKLAYGAANRALGDIVKVTPSSKVVGDLAQFMVQNGIPDEAALVERAGELSFPSSVVEFMAGAIGQPTGGFPEPLRSRVLKGAPTVDGRPGASLPPADLVGLEAELRERHGPVSVRDVLSAALYPKVFDEFKAWQLRYSPFTEALPTRAFLAPLDEDEEVEVELARGNTVSIKYKARSPLQADGVVDVSFFFFFFFFKTSTLRPLGVSGGRERAHTRRTHTPWPSPPFHFDFSLSSSLSLTHTLSLPPQLSPIPPTQVFFETNGVPRVIEVVDARPAGTTAGGGLANKRAARERADPMILGSVAAPMAGEVVEVKIKPGTRVEAGAPLAVLSAMKMETAVAAPVAGVVRHVALEAGDSVDAGDLVALIDEALPDVTDDAGATDSLDVATVAAAATGAGSRRG